RHARSFAGGNGKTLSRGHLRGVRPEGRGPARMSVNLEKIRTLFAAELRMVLRDPKILLTSILMPMLLMPLLLAGSHWTLRRREARLNEATYRYAVTGENRELVRQWFRPARREAAAGVASSESRATTL